MANQTLSDAYQHLTYTNTLFQQQHPRWQFLMESYVGGEEYRRANHLVRYALETAAEYESRIKSTPLDNHCKSVISVYISFLFREGPTRELAQLETDSTVQEFLQDADLEGRSLDSFMKEVATWSSVFGHCWVIMTKPAVPAETLADQLAQGVRPYVSLLTPLVVMDWRWQRQINGRYDLTYLKYIEDVNDTGTTVREWFPDRILSWQMDDKKREAELILEEPNGLGKIPAVLCYNSRGQVRGLGVSDIADIADQQRAIYNELSEVEQAIRLDGHPSLVKTPDTQIGTGAGSLIEMPENLDPGLKPYLLTTDGVPVNMIYESIRNRVESIDKMANTGGVRATVSREISGVAMETEFQLLNAKLSEKADNLELAEEQLWRLWCEYQGQQWLGEIDYPGSFNIRDTKREYSELQTAKAAATSPAVLQVIDARLLTALGEESVDITTVPQIVADPAAEQ